MKKTLYLFILAAAVNCALAINLPDKTMNAYRAQNLFELKRQIATDIFNEQQKLFISAIVNNAFCRNDISAGEIEKYIKNYPAEYTDTLYIEFMEVQLDNFVKMNEYKKAAGIAEMILTNANETLKDKDKKDLKNSLRIWKALSGTNKQEIIAENQCAIPFTRDIANLINIEVEAAAIKQNAVFDTGANLSVVVDSTAKKMNIIPLGDSISVKAATGTEINAQIGIAKELKISNITLKNVLFLIFPNEALSFGPFYKIDIVVGFPVIRALGQIIFDLKEKQIYVTNRELAEEGNMFLTGLMPIIKVNYENEELLFTFDSGAKETHFNKIFFATASKYPQNKIVEDSIQMGSAGGIHKKKVHKLEQAKLKVLEKEITLKDVNILQEDLLDIAEKTHGNLGQNVISSGKGFIMDFRKMAFKILD